jgi:hydroxymethylpyrimidine pyrophosphatase-like HAD family hydrolase
VNYLEAQRETGRPIVLATAADIHLARKVADHLKLFDLVFASDGATNLSGESKRAQLESVFGVKGFDYAANKGVDLPVWSSARKAIVINPGRRSRVARVATIDKTFESRKGAGAITSRAHHRSHKSNRGARPGSSEKSWIGHRLCWCPIGG